jgi:hypothetical protein
MGSDLRMLVLSFGSDQISHNCVLCLHGFGLVECV